MKRNRKLAPAPPSVNWEAAITAARPKNTEPGIAAHQFSGLRMKTDRNTAPMAAKISIGT
ncbi:hypothetical protein D3C86_2198500 [compost metagenome]